VTAAALPSGTSPSQPVPAVFEREYGCTQGEWLRWMPDAVHGHPSTQPRSESLLVCIGSGTLAIEWKVLAPRVIALIRLPRMAVHFDFRGVEPEARRVFMRRFDLHLQRGGG